DLGIDPRRAANNVKAAEAEKLVTAIRDVLNRAILAGGSSLRDYRQADGELGYFQHEFKVYGRTGETCPAVGCACGQKGGIIRITQGGRSTFFCPHRQK
ncbi:MAG: DNA-formamidopyrimidine glycosylase, partial [Alphaproteobacteria bacterium]|nr:DNA-formamidopyrimidine glycosylase [Alphaproteobacteria bacterium]